ncbi:MAG: MFS transporter [Candidatus Levyibacteriota bacterium]
MLSRFPSLAPFKIQSFRQYMTALFLIQFAFQSQLIAINWHMYTLTNSAIDLGFIGLLGFIPTILFSFVAGITVDKVNRKYLSIASRALYLLTSVILVWATATHTASPFTLYLVTFISAIAMTFGIPSDQSFFPALVPREKLGNAIAITTLSWQLSVIFGPMASGFIIALYGVQGVYVLTSVIFVISLFFLARVQYHNKEMVNEMAFHISSVIDGIKFLMSSPLIYSTMILDFFAMFFGEANVLMPIFARDILHIGPQGLGFLYAAPSIGAVIAGSVYASFKKVKRQGVILIFSVFVYGLAIVGFGFSKIFLLSLFFLAFIGAGDMISTIIRSSIRQLLTPDEMRGRVTSLNMIFFRGGPLLGETEAGFVAGAFGAPFSVVTGGIATVAVTIFLVIFIPMLKTYEEK